MSKAMTMWTTWAGLATLTFTVACAGPSASGSEVNSPHAVESSSGAEQSQAPSDQKTKKVADFSLETLDGNTVALSDYVGDKVVMLDFWATWCEPCLAAMPHLNRIYEKHKGDGFVLLSISMDGPDTVAEVRSYVQRHNLKFPVVLDEESRAVSLYNPKRSAPYSVLIAKDGTILHKRDGYQPGDETAIEQEVIQALGR